MGSQIAIVQSSPDEQELVTFLQQRERFVAVPFMMSRRDVQPVELGRCDAVEQMIFRAEDAPRLMAAIKEVENSPGKFQIDRNKWQGWFIEWDRTVWARKGEAQAGRFYYDRPRPPDSSAQVIDRTMKAIQTWVKKHSPAHSDDRHPMYVGADLWAKVQEGSARIVYPNGSAVTLVEA